MGVKVKKLRGSYYIQINFKGQRKTKKVGGTLESARDIAKKVEAKLIMGDLGIISEDKAVSPLVSEYAERWLEKHIQVTTKPATYAQYSQLMKTHPSAVRTQTRGCDHSGAC
jgi:integrase